MKLRMPERIVSLDFAGRAWHADEAGGVFDVPDDLVDAAMKAGARGIDGTLAADDHCSA